MTKVPEQLGWAETHATTARTCEAVARDKASLAEWSASINLKAATIREKFTAMRSLAGRPPDKAAR
jgi:hypothetical protein